MPNKIVLLILVALIITFGCKKPKATTIGSAVTTITIDSIVGSYVGNLHYQYSDFNLTHGIGTTTIIDTIIYADTFFVVKQSDDSSISVYTHGQYGPNHPYFLKYSELNSYSPGTGSPIQVTINIFPEKDSIAYSYTENWGSGGSEHPDHTEAFFGKKIK